MSKVTNHTEPDAIYCTVHPKIETSLRCNKCNRSMCIQCAVLTPVGYRCKECVRGQQAIFFNAHPYDPLIQLIICAPLSAIAAVIISVISRGFFLIYLIGVGASSFAGVMIADLAHRAVGRRRGRYSWLVVAAAMVVGALIPALVGAAIRTMLLRAASLTIPVMPFFLSTGFLNIGWWIYLVVGTATAIGRLRLGR